MAEELEKDGKTEKPAKKNAKSDKSTKKKQKSHKISNYFKDLKSELKKITWFSAQDTLKNSVWVVVALVILSIVIGAIDWCFGTLIALVG
jgi:preprotein translocase subunit SecE